MIETTESNQLLPFAERIRQSFEQLKLQMGEVRPSDLSPGEPAMIGLTWDQLARVARNTINSGERDGAYPAVIRSYQRGTGTVWAPLLLEILAPALSRRAEKLFSAVATINRDDIEQQITCEVLRLARSHVLDGGVGFDVDLAQRATRRVARWLRRAQRHTHADLEGCLDLVAPPPKDELRELERLCDGEIAKEDVILVYRFDVRRESISSLAAGHGITVRAAYLRIGRARRRLRQRLGPAGGSQADRAA